MILLACIDGGLFCGPIIALIFALGGGGAVTAFYKKWRKTCKKACNCKCHPVKKQE